MRLAPVVTAVGRFEYAAAGQDKAPFFPRKIDVIDCVIDPQRPFDPGGAAIFGIGQKAAIAGHPSMLRINKGNRVQVPATRVDLAVRPSALRATESRREQNAPERREGQLFPFANHQLSEVLHINCQLTKAPRAARSRFTLRAIYDCDTS